MSDDSGVIGQRPLSQVILPASHDSGTYAIPLGENILTFGFPVTQDLDFYQQLMNGAREFDLRFMDYQQHLVFEHALIPGTVDVDFYKVMQQLQTFLNAPGHDKEIIILDYTMVTHDYAFFDPFPDPVSDQVQRINDACNAFESTFGSKILTPQELITNLDQVVSDPNSHTYAQYRSLNEIWALPGHPQLVVEGLNCSGMPVWPALQNGSRINAIGQNGFYANSDITQTMIDADANALEARATANDNTSPSVPAKYVPGLYNLHIQETGVGPSLPTSIQSEQAVLSSIQSWFRGNQHSARHNLNSISGDFIERVPLVENVRALNQTTAEDPYAGGPQISASLQTIVPLTGAAFPYTPGTITGGDVRISVSCSTTQGYVDSIDWSDGGGTQTSIANPAQFTINLTSDVTDKMITLVCTDASSSDPTNPDSSGRVARLVIGPITIQHPPAGTVDSVRFGLPSPPETSVPDGINLYPGQVPVTVQATDPIDVTGLTCTVKKDGSDSPELSPLTSPALPSASVSGVVGIYSEQGAYGVTCLEQGVAGTSSSSTRFIIDTSPPAITRQPQDTTVTYFQHLMLSVSANSTTFAFGSHTETVPQTYQWYRNGNPIAGATDSSYIVYHAAMSDGGDYSVTVTNVAGKVTSQAASVTVLRATPTINWSSPAPITYGTPLGNLQLNAEAVGADGNSLAGTFSYTPAASAILGAGAQTLSASFTPFDTADYTTATATTQLAVNRAVLTVTADDLTKTIGAPNPPLTYAISGFVNGENASVVSGAPSLSTTATASSPVGTYPISVDTGTLAASNYDFKPVDGTLTVTYAICPPTDHAGAATPGAALPIQVTLCDANGSNVSASGIELHAVSMTLLPNGTSRPAAATGNANPGNDFRLTGNSYLYLLDTKGLPVGTYNLTFTVTGDPLPHTVQFQIGNTR